ncbi:unnamed protein product [Toxocara canis]|uniref:RING-type domain-containing protein n=1 Tax=Toxocara canis TaxID=6265 RepID=A0A183UPB9_TOXCA|nr:unnamed protein product [Toxocara canis]
MHVGAGGGGSHDTSDTPRSGRVRANKGRTSGESFDASGKDAAASRKVHNYRKYNGGFLQRGAEQELSNHSWAAPARVICSQGIMAAEVGPEAEEVVLHLVLGDPEKMSVQTNGEHRAEASVPVKKMQQLVRKVRWHSYRTWASSQRLADLLGGRSWCYLIGAAFLRDRNGANIQLLQEHGLDGATWGPRSVGVPEAMTAELDPATEEVVLHLVVHDQGMVSVKAMGESQAKESVSAESVQQAKAMAAGQEPGAEEVVIHLILHDPEKVSVQAKGEHRAEASMPVEKMQQLVGKKLLRQNIVIGTQSTVRNLVGTLMDIQILPGGDYGSRGGAGSGGSGAASGTPRSREGVGVNRGRTSGESFGASGKGAAAGREAWGGAGPEQSFLGGSRSCYMQPGRALCGIMAAEVEPEAEEVVLHLVLHDRDVSVQAKGEDRAEASVPVKKMQQLVGKRGAEQELSNHSWAVPVRVICSQGIMAAEVGPEAEEVVLHLVLGDPEKVSVQAKGEHRTEASVPVKKMQQLVGKPMQTMLNSFSLHIYHKEKKDFLAAWGGAGPEQSFLGGSRSCYMQPGTFGGGAGVRSGRSGSLSSGGTSSGGNTTGSYGGYGAGGATNRNASTGSKAWGGSGPERSFLGGTRSCYMLPGTPGGGVSAGNRKNDNVGDGGESGGASSSGASGRGAKAKRGSTGRKGGAGSQQSFDSGARSVYFGPR